jgi:hypothetical protein
MYVCTRYKYGIGQRMSKEKIPEREKLEGRVRLGKKGIQGKVWYQEDEGEAGSSHRTHSIRLHCLKSPPVNRKGGVEKE